LRRPIPLSERDVIWNMMFERLAAFRREHEHCRVPVHGADRRLGNWVSNQRQAEHHRQLPLERRYRLLSLGFEFVAGEAGREKMLAGLAAFKRHGHTQVPRHWNEPRGLGSWVARQRQLHNRGRLTPEHSHRLKELKFDFAPVDPRWNAHYARLIKFQKKHGHCNVPSGDRFGQWVYKQRRFYRAGKLTARQVRRLEAIGFHWVKPGPVTVVNAARWSHHLRALMKFKELHGHCQVPQTWKNRRGLGVWVANVRDRYRRGELSAERIRALENLGFVWRITPSSGSSQAPLRRVAA
jgi:Helicase associated domain